MKILRMQATFGKLNQATLELRDGLNIITAENEAGKSTWCAFLLAMLYGIDTAQRSSRDTIADKLRYQSWDGKPMAGRLDLEWQGRNITIERTAKGRVPLGEFRAYETASGVPVQELTALNCGQLLTGATRSVFERSAFVRQDAHAVTADETLEQLLQKLVTTGETSVSGQAAMQQMQQLKNRCKHNKTGLISETEAKLADLRDTLGQMALLDREMALTEAEVTACRTVDRIQSTEQDQRNLESVEQAKAQWEESLTECQLLQEKVETLPAETQLETWQSQLRTLMETQIIPEEAPLAPPALQDMTPPEAAAAARRDSDLARELEKSAPPRLWIRLMPLLLLAGAVVLRQELWAVLLCGGMGIGLTVILLLLWLWRNKHYQQKQTELTALLTRYQVDSADQMLQQARDYLQQLRAWQERREKGDVRTQEVQQALLSEIATALPVTQLPEAAAALQQAKLDYVKWKNTVQRCQTAQQHYAQLKAAVDPITPRDSEQTRRLEQKLAELRGRRDAMGDGAALTARVQELEERLSQLQDYYAAIELAMTALRQAEETLQNRFAPPLRRLTEQYLEKLTAGAYRDLTVDRQMQMTLRQDGETVGHPGGYYSGGTRDQMYLALRLAIAELLLASDCPVVLDDALVRFDDRRLHSALELLTELSRKRQILLFSCQTREANWQAAK